MRASQHDAGLGSGLGEEPALAAAAPSCSACTWRAQRDVQSALPASAGSTVKPQHGEGWQPPAPHEGAGRGVQTRSSSGEKRDTNCRLCYPYAASAAFIARLTPVFATGKHSLLEGNPSAMGCSAGPRSPRTAGRR